MAKVDIDIGAKTTRFRKGVDQLDARVKRFGKEARGVMLRAFAVTAVIGGLRSLAQEMDRIDKLSKRFGIDTGALQDLSLQADLSGASLEGVARSMSRLVKEINRADGPSAEVARELDALGLNVEKLRGMKPAELFAAVSETVGGLASETDQLTAAQNLLGRSGAELLPMIQDVFQNGMADAPKHTQGAIDATVQFNDTMTKLGQQLKSFVSPVIVVVGSLIQALMRTMNQAGTNIGNAITLISNLFQTAGHNIGNILTGLMDTLKGVGRLIKAVFTFDKGEISKAMEDVKKEFTEGIDRIFSDSKDPFDTLRKDFDRMLDDSKDYFGDIADIGKKALAGIGLGDPLTDTGAPSGRERTGTRTTVETEPGDESKRMVAELQREEQGLINAIGQLKDAFMRQVGTGTSSLQAIGGGGTSRQYVSGDALKRIQQKQLDNLDRIRKLMEEQRGQGGATIQ